jgi:tryptophanase
VKEGDIVVGNSPFDTTKGHIEFRKATAVDCTVDIASDTDLVAPFKGNVDIEKFDKFIAENQEKVSFCLLTLTNNSAGGQPVSMENIKAVRAIATKYNKQLLFDSARFAENAYFIKTRESGYENKTIREIVREMYENADLITMSCKKDAIVNIGGFMAMRDQDLMRKVSAFSVMNEGYLTYGGLAGRDMNAIAVGLFEGTLFDTLDTRIKQVEYLGKRLEEFGIPYQKPAGGHAIFLDANKILPNLPRDEFRAQTLGIELYIEGGVRGVEIGTVLADRDPITKENRFPKLELLRLAIPRRVYNPNHIVFV